MKKTRILIVEDEILVAENIKDILTESYYVVLDVVATGKKAIQQTKMHLPDIVLMDITLKGDMDGIEAAKIIQNDTGVPVVFLTAHDERTTFNKAKLTDTFGFISKPFHGRQLTYTIEMALYKSKINKEKIELIVELQGEIIERKKVEKELRKSEEKLRQIGDNIPKGQIFQLLVKTDGKSKFTYVSKKVEELHECTVEQVLKDSSLLFSRILPEDLPALQSTTENSIREMCEYDHVVRIRRKSGEIRWHRMISRPRKLESGDILFDGLDFDITEQKKAEEALRQSEVTFKDAFSTAAIGMALISPEGRFLKVNESLCGVVGYDDQELLSLTFQDITHPDDMEIDLNYLHQLLVGEINNYHMEKRYFHKNGNTIWIMLSVSLVRDANGEPIHFVSQILDITERKQLEEQLAQSQKMESIGQLAGGVAHDFNNIIQAISLNTELSLNSIPPDSPLEDSLKEIKTNSDRAADLTRQLLAFSRRQIIQPKILSLNDIIYGMKKMIGRLIGENIEVVTILHDDLWMVNVDKGQIEQVVTNIAVNARDAMPIGGKLTIETANVTIDEEFVKTHQGVELGDYVMLAVNDTGIGMEEITKSKVFEPFFTTKGVGEGTGLGLSTCYGIVKQNNGYISVESAVGIGTTFKIYLPKAKTEEAADTVKDITLEELPKGTETILLVEDEQSVLKAKSSILSLKGYTVITASNGVEAWSIIEKHGETIQLVITDVVMPQMGGKELADKIHETNPDIKVLFMSGYTDDSIAHHGVLEDDVAFLQKPASINDLLNKVRQVLDA